MCSGSFENVINKMYLQIIHILYIYIYMYKQDLALNNLMLIIYIFRTIVLIFVAMFITMFRPLYAPAFLSPVNFSC